MVKLLGIGIVALGFALGWNALGVVLAAGIVTGLIAGFSLREIVEMTGKFFAENRALVLPVILMVPIVGLVERHGLHHRVAALMHRMRRGSPGRVLWLYQVARGLTSTVGMSIGNHASMVRPLIAPMAEGAVARERALTPERRDAIRAHAAASENVGNFFSDDILVAVGALLLIEGFFRSVGTPIVLADLQIWSIPTALWVIAVGWWRCRRLDRRLARKPEDAP